MLIVGIRGGKRRVHFYFNKFCHLELQMSVSLDEKAAEYMSLEFRSYFKIYV